jgi:septum formation protein
MPDFIYLASQSPRRSQLLEQIGVPHRLLVPNAPGDVAEDTEALELVLPGEPPAAYVERVTALKLDAAVQRLARRGLPTAPILCSDTTVALNDRIFGKPLDADDARHMLAQLSGQEHRVLTAVAVQAGAQRFAALSVSHVRFAELDSAQIDAYVATGEPLGKAGAYGIQGPAAAFIAHISGSYSGIMGLPLYETAQLLRQAGLRF